MWGRLKDVASFLVEEGNVLLFLWILRTIAESSQQCHLGELDENGDFKPKHANMITDEVALPEVQQLRLRVSDVAGMCLWKKNQFRTNTV